MSKIVLMKWLDLLSGPVLVPIVNALCTPRACNTTHPGKVLFIRPGGIGDAVLLIPAIQMIKKKFPAAVVHVLAERRNGEVFSLCPDVERVFRYDKPTELISVIRSSYDAVIDTEQWHRLSAVAARLTRAPMLIGFATNERKALFTNAVPYSHDDYESVSFLHLIEPLVGKAGLDTPSRFISATEQVRAQTNQYLELVSHQKYVALFPGGSIPERRWGVDRFRTLAEQLARKGYGVVVIGGKDDLSAGEGIVRGIPSGLNLCGRLTLSGSAAVLERASLLITGDSGIMHLGYAVGTRVLALFGPGIENKWAPRSPRVAILNKHLPCSPCTKFGYTPKCPRDTACMKGISIEDVISSAIALLDKQ